MNKIISIKENTSSEIIEKKSRFIGNLIRVDNEEDANLSELALAYFAYNLKNVTRSTSANKDTPGVEGNDYTDELILAVKDRLELSEQIKHIVIASASGKSALKLADAVGDQVKIINVTHHCGFSGPNESDISNEMIKKLENEGIVTYFGLHAFSGAARGVTNKYGGYSPLDVVDICCEQFA